MHSNTNNLLKLILLSIIIIVNGGNDPMLWKAFLMNNRMKQCSSRPEQIPMPLSFYVPGGYFDSIPPSNRVDPSRAYTQPEIVPACNAQLIQPDKLNAYAFQCERFMATLGLNIYDGSVHSMAISLLGEVPSALQYEQSIISAGKTCQFGDIKADKPCKGIIRIGECNDTLKTGVCGFCYGEGNSQPFQNAWTFRFLSDYWSLQGTIDARCPELGHTWIWNDYKPVLGENAWANLIAPLQIAFINYGKSVENIPPNDISLTMSLALLPSIQQMVSSVGGVFYSPKNCLDFGDVDLGYTLSTENNVSLLAGLKMLRYILAKKGLYPDKVAQIDALITGITNYIKSSYDDGLGFFRTGGVFDPVTNQFSWYEGPTQFSVDCQTWTMSVIGPIQIDNWFGKGTSAKIWANTKKIGGYHYTNWNGNVDGLGFANNTNAGVISGEWTLGGINMLNIFANMLDNDAYQQEADTIRTNIAAITDQAYINNVNCYGVRYANKRYWIPFGWFSNAIMSTASTAWAVFVDSGWNPFYLGGGYGVVYPN